jgi:soluble lytic murein transglycosylase-like protein
VRALFANLNAQRRKGDGMKTLLIVLTAFMLGIWNYIYQPVKNDERPLPIVSAQAALASNQNKTAKVEIKPSTNAKQTAKVTSKKPADDSGVKKKIAGLIKMVQPRKGQAYADHVSEVMVKEARRYGLDPYVVASTGYIESEFSMASRPCMGIMQVERRTYNWKYRKSGLNPMDLEDNIRLGAWELADKAKMSSRAQSRIALASRGVLSRMWGRYNGAGARSGYVRRAHLTLTRFKNMSLIQMQDHIKKKGPLWKP